MNDGTTTGAPKRGPLRLLIAETADIVAVRFVGAIAGIHLWNGIFSFGPDRWFDSPGLKYVNLIDPRLWGVAFIVTAIALFMAMASERWTKLGRVALGHGMFLCLTQCVLTALTFFDGEPTAAPRAVGLWGGLGLLHAACLLSSRRIHRR